MRRRCAAITQGLMKLGLLKGALAGLIKEQAYLPFFIHRTGHWLGLDVHDVGDYKDRRRVARARAGHGAHGRAGDLHPTRARVPKEFWNIGMRIEDDVLVTAGGTEVLTAELEKTPEAVERLVQSA